MKYFMIIFLILTVNTYAGGQTDTSSVSSAELDDIINSSDSDYILIDVRTAEEYSEGHIPAAVNIPYDVIADNLPTQDKDKYIIVYCRSGRRSGIAKNTLESLGYLNVINFGGVSKWQGVLIKD
jgi:rhodanese-related sulfurtransferase